jgi:hypothetical protein
VNDSRPAKPLTGGDPGGSRANGYHHQCLLSDVTSRREKHGGADCGVPPLGCEMRKKRRREKRDDSNKFKTRGVYSFKFFSKFSIISNLWTHT